MDPIVLAAATAVVGAMATDAWQQTRMAVVAWWREMHPREAEDIGHQMETTRSGIQAAGEGDDEGIRQALTDAWQLRFQQLLNAKPGVGPELRRFLDEHLTPALPPAEQAHIQQTIHAHAQGQARQYISGRDQHITGP